MALSTREGADAPKQHDTLGIGKQGDPPKTAAPEPAKPVLFPDIDPVLLVRLYPDAANSAEAKAQAMKAGQTAYDAAMLEPVPAPVAGEPAPHDPHAPHANKKP